MNKIINFDNQKIKIDFQNYAFLSQESLVIEVGETKLLITLNTKNFDESPPNFLPLQVIFQERMYSVNKIPGGFNKREAKPSEYSILVSRIIDRTIRPLFPKNLATEIQIVVTTLSIDNEDIIPFLATLGTSLIIQKSGLPFEGPVSGIGLKVSKDKKLSFSHQEKNDEEKMASFFFAGPKNLVNMIEFDGEEIEKKEFLNYSKSIFSKIEELNNLQKDFLSGIKPLKDLTFNEPKKELLKVFDNYVKQMEDNISTTDMKIRRTKTNDLINLIKKEHNEFSKQEIIETFYYIFGPKARSYIFKNQKRLDGRKIEEIRTIKSTINLSKNDHGSAIFQRGYTQVASFITLSSLESYQMIENTTSIKKKNFLHHYNFPPFSVGETGRMGMTSRREIGHGNLAEKSIANVLPSLEEFPYTIRIVSEVLSSNGSTSQGAICAATLSLMDAGIKIKSPISGIAIGLLDKENIILTDIDGGEDHIGDMDFKISGSKKGFTAIQMDMKIEGINIKKLAEIVQKGESGYLSILDNMLLVIDKPNNDLKPNAIKYETITINVNKIATVIGPGGKMIKKIIQEFDDPKMDINDDGIINIYHQDRETIKKVIESIEALTKEYKIGDKIKDAVIVKIVDFGVFVSIGKQEVLIHVSKLSDEFVSNPSELFNEGDKLDVEIIEIKKGKLNGKKI